MRAPKRHLRARIVWSAAALVGVGLTAACGGSVAAGTTPSATPSTVKTGAIGTPVTRDGIFEYTVTAATCDGVAIDDARPKGRFCSVGITVHNLGGTARKPGISFARGYDAGGVGYAIDAVAQIRSERSGTALLDDLPAGGRITDRMVYDLPKDATLAAVVLHESPASPGIRVALG